MAAGKQSRHSNHVIRFDDKRILKTSVLFGPNASGKSNLVKAVEFAKNIAVLGLNETVIAKNNFRIDNVSIDKPCVLQFDFISNNKIYNYGFAFSFKTASFISEWLYRIESKETCVFEREVGKTLHTDLKFSDDNKTRLSIYSEDLADNKSLLSEITDHKLQQETDFADFYNVLDWFGKLIIIFPTSKYSRMEKIMMKDSLIKIGEYLNRFDTGVEGLKDDVKPCDEMFNELNEDVRTVIISNAKKFLDEGQKNRTYNFGIGENRFCVTKENDTLMASKVLFNHGNEDALFDFEDESDGTKRLFDLIPLLSIKNESYVILIDEIDRSFHTKITKEFIKAFLGKSECNNSQIIVTTHDLNLMDLELLRQDEIWFVERGVDHSSKMYSLSKFQARFDKAVAKDYLLGRFGSLPFVSINAVYDDVEEGDGVELISSTI